MLNVSTLPHSADHQLITDLANSSRSTAETCRQAGHHAASLHLIHAARVHELMRYRSHTVNTDGF